MRPQTMIAVVICGALGLLAVLSLTRDPARGISRIDFRHIKSDTIDKVVLAGAHNAELVKSGDTWQLGSKLADKRAVEQLVEAIAKIRSSDMVTTNSSRFADFEVDDEKGTEVKAYANNAVVAELRVGKASKGGTHIRVGREVFAVSGVYPRTFNKDGNAWLEKKLFSEKVNEIAKVQVKLAGQAPYELVKKEGKWAVVDESLLPPGFRFDSSAASRLVSSLVSMRAKEILEEDPGPEKTKLIGDYDALSFSTAAPEPPAGGETTSSEPVTSRELRLGAADAEDKTVYVQVVGRADIMTVYESTVKNLRKMPTDFRDMKMVTLEKDKVTKLAIQVDGKSLTFEKKGSDWSVGASSESVPSDFTLDPMAVTRRLSSLANARGTGVAQVSPSAAGLGRPSATVTATLEDGKQVQVTFGRETKHDDRDVVYAAGNADNAVYFVNSYTKKNLTGLLDTFKKRDTPQSPGGGFGNLDPAALKNLPPDVRRSLEEQMRKEKMQQKMLKRLQAQQDK